MSFPRLERIQPLIAGNSTKAWKEGLLGARKQDIALKSRSGSALIPTYFCLVPPARYHGFLRSFCSGSLPSSGHQPKEVLFASHCPWHCFLFGFLIVESGLELVIFLPQPCKELNYRPVSPGLVSWNINYISTIQHIQKHMLVVHALYKFKTYKITVIVQNNPNAHQRVEG